MKFNTRPNRQHKLLESIRPRGERRLRFATQLIIYMMLMLIILETIQARYWTKMIMWGLFSYIIMIEVVKYFRDAKRRQKCLSWPITLFYSSHKITGDLMAFELKTDEVLPFRIGKPVDANEDEAELDENSLSVTTTNPAVFTVEADPDYPSDPYAGLIVAQGKGAAILRITGDADLGDGVTEISQEIAGEVIALDAVGFGAVSFGTPRKKTETTTPTEPTEPNPGTGEVEGTVEG